jgi:hypothetical protein
VIDLTAIIGLLEHDHKLTAYCLRCDRRSVLPLAELVAHGKGTLRLPVRVRCRDCGEPGQLQQRPPRYAVHTDAYSTRRTSRSSHYPGDMGTATFT